MKVCEICGEPVFEITEYDYNEDYVLEMIVYECSDTYDFERPSSQQTYCGHKSYTYKEKEKDESKS